MITVLLCIVCVLLIALGYVLFRYAKLSAYARKADGERLALAIQVGELKELQQFISFKK